MKTLVLKLEGMQSWGASSRHSFRDTRPEPTKSGVIGMLASALGIPRDNWDTPAGPHNVSLEQLSKLKFAVRRDRSGSLLRDFQTIAGPIPKSGGGFESNSYLQEKMYLQDAAFMAGVESDDEELIKKLQDALESPHWHIFLGRKGCAPACDVDGGAYDGDCVSVLKSQPKNVFKRNDHSMMLSYDSDDGSGTIVCDDIVGPFSNRVFGDRLVKSEVI